MCNVGDDIDEQENNKFMQEKHKFDLFDNKCIKCRTEQPKIVLHNKYIYCKSCFVAATVHKFKAFLGKNHVVHPNDSVLVCYRAGHPSTALLHFLRMGLDLTTPKKIRFKPVVLFIENHYNLPVEQRKQILQKISEEVCSLNFPVYFVPLAQYMLHPMDLSSLIQQDFQTLKISEEDTINIKSVVKNKASLTFQQEVLKIFERDLLVQAAKYLNCRSIFMPDVGIDIAAQLLTNISLGRGAHAVYDTGIVDQRNSKITIVRPLRNFSIKELAFYNIFSNLEPVSFLSVLQNPHSSIQHLMMKFVSDLQVNYPATVSTIVRTGDKLGVEKNIAQTQTCELCKAPLEKECNKLSSAEATQFSHWISTQAPNCNVSVEEHSKQLLDNFSNRRGGTYCFACSRTVDFL